MSEENKAIYRQFTDAMNAKDITIVDRLMDPNFVDHDLPPGQPPGAQGMKDMMSMFFAAFPDLKSTIDLIVAEGDLVTGHMTTEGTHTGDFMGIPATGKKVSFSEVHTVRIANGKAAERWGVADAMGMMQQLGVIPAE